MSRATCCNSFHVYFISTHFFLTFTTFNMIIKNIFYKIYSLIVIHSFLCHCKWSGLTMSAAINNIIIFYTIRWCVFLSTHLICTELFEKFEAILNIFSFQLLSVLEFNIMSKPTGLISRLVNRQYLSCFTETNI